MSYWSYFKNTLYNDLKEKIANVSHDFSMHDYITNMSKYQYLTAIGVEDIFNTIENMSVPFAQGAVLPNPKRLLICYVDATEQDNWQNMVETQYPSMPAIANDTSIQKITFIQIQKYKLNETHYGNQ